MYIYVDCVSELADNTLEAGFLASQCLNVMFPTTKQLDDWNLPQYS